VAKQLTHNPKFNGLTKTTTYRFLVRNNFSNVIWEKLNTVYWVKIQYLKRLQIDSGVLEINGKIVAELQPLPKGKLRKILAGCRSTVAEQLTHNPMFKGLTKTGTYRSLVRSKFSNVIWEILNNAYGVKIQYLKRLQIDSGILDIIGKIVVGLQPLPKGRADENVGQWQQNNQLIILCSRVWKLAPLAPGKGGVRQNSKKNV
jgi:hypothetical protein